MNTDVKQALIWATAITVILVTLIVGLVVYNTTNDAQVYEMCRTYAEAGVINAPGGHSSCGIFSYYW